MPRKKRRPAFPGNAQDAARKVYEKEDIPIESATDRVRHIMQCAFDGRRIVVFSGGAKKADDNAIFDEVRAIRDGGGNGSIIGRNTFQRKRDDALKLLDTIIKLYAGEMK